MSRWSWWSRRSQVERVDLYTRQSLYVLLWGVTLVVIVGAGPAVGDHEGAGIALVIGSLVVTAAATVVLRDVSTLHPALGPIPWHSAGPFLGLVALAGIGVLLLPEGLSSPASLILWGAAAWALGGLRDRRALVLLMIGLTLIPLLGEVAWFGPVYGLVAGAFVVFTVRTSLWLIGVVRDLERGREAQAALAVAEERLRFSRDLHDVMGRRLSAIAVKSDLAASLAARGDRTSAEQMLEVRGVAHEAMREARELVGGYRSVDLDQELEGARALLRSAGIAVELDVTDLPEGWHEAAAWVVRESVTNVLRHSRAVAVTIRYSAPELTVCNDGPISAAATGGSGLAGLRERLVPLGGEISFAGDDDTFVLTARLPGTGPEDDS